MNTLPLHFSQPIVRPRRDGHYETAEPYEFTVDGCDAVVAFEIPARFIYDGASIPSLTGLTWAATYSPFHPLVMGPALVHDFFCLRRFPFMPYDEAARLFRDMLAANGVPSSKGSIMYRAVLHFGPKW